jgi:outer membrane beta-barrel protein
MRISVGILTALILSSQSAWSEDPIQFAEEELARESVYPVFDETNAVLRRRVVTAKALELNIFGGAAFNDPFFNPLSFGGGVGYHFSEIHGAQLLGGLLTNTPSQYVDPLRVASDQNYKFAPAPKYYFLGVYEFTPFYGKLSITKETVCNLALNFSGGAGAYAIGTEVLPTLVLGFGQKFFFGPGWGLNIDLKTLTFNGPDAASRDLRPSPPASSPGTNATPANSQFTSRIQTHFLLNVGLLFLL